MGDQHVFSIASLLTSILNIILLCLLLFLFILAIKALIRCNKNVLIKNKHKCSNELSLRPSLGETIKIKRIEMNFSQECLAEQIGVSRQAVAKWERNASFPSMANLSQIAKVLKIPIEDLVSSMSASTR